MLPADRKSDETVPDPVTVILPPLFSLTPFFSGPVSPGQVRLDELVNPSVTEKISSYSIFIGLVDFLAFASFGSVAMAMAAATAELLHRALNICFNGAWTSGRKTHLLTYRGAREKCVRFLF